MDQTPNTRRLGLVIGLAVVLVAATPAPNTGQNGALVTPTPVRVTMKPTPTPTPIHLATPTPTPRVTPTPTPTPTPSATPIILHTPPPKLVLSDSVQFDGPQFCKLTSDVSDHDQPNAAGVAYENPAPMHCRITAQHFGLTSGIATISVPGNPNETIVFKYSMSGSTVTPSAVREVEGPAPYPATITGTMHGVPGTPGFYGNIKVWELSTAP